MIATTPMASATFVAGCSEIDLARDAALCVLPSVESTRVIADSPRASVSMNDPLGRGGSLLIIFFMEAMMPEGSPRSHPRRQFFFQALSPISSMDGKEDVFAFAPPSRMPPSFVISTSSSFGISFSFPSSSFFQSTP